MPASTALKQRLADALTMLIVSGLGIAILYVVALGSTQRTYEQLVHERVGTQGQIIQSASEAFLRSGLPLRDFTGFRKLATQMTANDPALQSVELVDNIGARLDFVGTASPRRSERSEKSRFDGSPFEIARDEGTSAIRLGLRDRFEAVGAVILSVDRHRVQATVNERFVPLLPVAVLACIGFAAYAGYGSPRLWNERRRELAIAYLASFSVVAVSILSTIVGLYAAGAESKGTALAASLGQRLSGIPAYGIGIDQISGLDAVVQSYRAANPEVTSVAILMDGAVVVRSDRDEDMWRLVQAGETIKHSVVVGTHGGQSLEARVEVPRSAVRWRVLRAVKDFAALFVASALLAYMIARSAQALRSKGSGMEVGEASAWRGVPVFFLAVMADNLTYAFLPQHVEAVVLREGLPPGFAALPFTLYYFTFAAALIVGNVWGNRATARTMAMTGLATVAVGALALAGLEQFAAIGAARALSGLGQGLVFIAIQSRLLSSEPDTDGPRLGNLIVFGFQGGMIAGMALGSLLVDQIGETRVFLLSSALAMTAVGYGLFGMSCRGSESIAASTSPDPVAGRLRRDVHVVLRDPSFIRAVLLIGIPAKAILTGVIMFAVPLLLTNHGVGRDDIGQIIMIYAAMVLLSNEHASKMAARFGLPATMLTGVIVATAGLALVAAGAGQWISLAFEQFDLSTLAFVTGIAVIGLGHGLVNAPVVDYVTSTDAANRIGGAAAAASYRLMERGGHALGPAAMGLAFSVAGRDDGGLLIMLSLTLLAGAAFAFWCRGHAPAATLQQEHVS